jgi:hypothetical protein
MTISSFSRWRFPLRKEPSARCVPWIVSFRRKIVSEPTTSSNFHVTPPYREGTPEVSLGRGLTTTPGLHAACGGRLLYTVVRAGCNARDCIISVAIRGVGN